MKLTLAFDIYNKEQWIQSLLESWLDNLSGRHEVEVIIVFDDCRDASPEIAERVLLGRGLDYQFLYADDEYEIFCNDLAFQHATGDFIIFIQDDNWIYDRDWDDTLAEVLGRVDNVGAVGLLAGVEMRRGPRLSYRRIEVNRPHKGDNFGLEEVFDLAVWCVDAINRPFGISTDLLREMGGLDFAFRPMDFDDMDLSLKLLQRGYTNIYVPFDLLNVVGKRSTIGESGMRKNWLHGYQLCRARHGEFVRRRLGTSLSRLYSLEERSGLLHLGESLRPASYGLRMRMAHTLLPMDVFGAYYELRRTCRNAGARAAKPVVKYGRRRLRNMMINVRQSPLTLSHRPGRELRALMEEAEDICSVVKNDAVLGEYFIHNNPWADRPWGEFDYWNGWYALAKLRQPKRILEIGTGFGFSTIALARGAGENLQLLVSLDLGNIGSLFTHEGFPEMDSLKYVWEGISRYKEEHGLNFEYLQFEVNTQPPPYTDNEGNPVECPHWRADGALVLLLDQTWFDLILIDGKHTGDELYNDLISFFDYANPGCLIVCDDLQHRDPIAALTKFVRTHRSKIADYCIWRYLHCNAEYGGTLRRDQGLLFKS